MNNNNKILIIINLTILIVLITILIFEKYSFEISKNINDNNFDYNENLEILKNKIDFSNINDTIEMKKIRNIVLLSNKPDNTIMIFEKMKILCNKQNRVFWENSIKKAKKYKIIKSTTQLLPNDKPHNTLQIDLYSKTEHDSIIYSELLAYGFLIKLKKSKNTGHQINSIWYNRNININYVKVVALILIKNHYNIVDIRPFEKDNQCQIQIGNEPLWETSKYAKPPLNYNYIIQTDNFEPDIKFLEELKK